MDIAGFFRKYLSDSPLVHPLIGVGVAFVLLLPLLFIATSNRLIPMQLLYGTALTKENLMRPAEFIGTENYERMAEDERFIAAQAYTSTLTMSRVGAVAIMPLIVGLLIGVQGLVGRAINRLLLSGLAAIISPVGLAILWANYWGRLWGREPSPLWPIPDSLQLTNPEGAQNSLLLLDGSITGLIALVVGGLAYAAVLRGRHTGRWGMLQAGVGVWLVGVLLALGSAAKTFILPYVLTQGGPGNATITLPFSLYNYGFRQFRIGYASAQATLLIPMALGITFLIWLVVTVFRIRVSYTPNPKPLHRYSSLLSLVSVPLIVFLALSLVGLVVWGRGLTLQASESASILEQVDWGQALLMTLIPLTVIWAIQIPVTYLGGFALGFIRPLGSIGSSVVFLGLLLITSIPDEAIMFEWFKEARNGGILNTPDGLAFPWLVSGLSLLVFKLFFDGTYEKYQAARADGKTASDAFLFRVFLPSLPIVLVVGVVMSFVSTQSLFWPLVVSTDRELFNLPMTLVMFRGQLATDMLPMTSATLLFIGQIGIPFAVILALLNVFVLDRLAILGGKSVTPETAAPAEEPLADLPA